MENYHNTTNIGINYHDFLPLYKEARAKTYTEQNVKSAFRKTVIFPSSLAWFYPKRTAPTLPTLLLKPPSSSIKHHILSAIFAGRPIKYLVLSKQQAQVKYVTLFFASLILQNTTLQQPILPQVRCKDYGQKSRSPRMSKGIAELLAGQE